MIPPTDQLKMHDVNVCVCGYIVGVLCSCVRRGGIKNINPIQKLKQKRSWGEGARFVDGKTAFA